MSGTLFDGDEASGWNPDKLDTCLQLLLADLDNGDDNETIAMPGVTSAYLYFGQFGAVFTAHTEDMNLLSINYLHAGEPKVSTNEHMHPFRSESQRFRNDRSYSQPPKRKGGVVFRHATSHTSHPPPFYF